MRGQKHQNLNILDIFWANTPISHYMRVHAVGAELFLADGRDEDFRSFANVPKNDRMVT
jgi:hypothetical protein